MVVKMRGVVMFPLISATSAYLADGARMQDAELSQLVFMCVTIYFPQMLRNSITDDDS